MAIDHLAKTPIDRASKAVPVVIYDPTGTAYSKVTDTDGLATASALYVEQARNALYNGATWDRQRGNVEGTLLASAQRTATTDSPIQTNHNARGIVVHLDVTAASGTGGLTVQIRPVNPVAGNSAGAFPFSASAIIANSYTPFVLYPGITPGSLAISAALPRSFVVRITHGDGSNYTYSVGYSLIV